MCIYPPPPLYDQNLVLLLNTDMDATKTINKIKHKSVLTNATLTLIVLQKKNLATLKITDLNIDIFLSVKLKKQSCYNSSCVSLKTVLYKPILNWMQFYPQTSLCKD